MPSKSPKGVAPEGGVFMSRILGNPFPRRNFWAGLTRLRPPGYSPPSSSPRSRRLSYGGAKTPSDPGRPPPGEANLLSARPFSLSGRRQGRFDLPEGEKGSG